MLGVSGDETNLAIRVVRVWPRLPVGDSAPGLAILAALPPAERPGDAGASIGLTQALGYTIRESDDGGQAWVAAAVLEESSHPAGAICCVFDGPQPDKRALHEAGRTIAEAARRASSNADMRSGAPFIQPKSPAGDARGVRTLETGRDFMGENPLYAPAENRLYWLDILAPALRWLDLATGQSSRRLLPEIMGGVALYEPGSLLLAGRHGLHRYDLASETLTLLIDLEPTRPDNRFNTIAIDAQGGVWGGTQAVENSPGHGSLYRIGPDLSSRIGFPQVGLPKNVAWSPDGATLYFPDGRDRCVYAFDVEPGHRLANRRVLVSGDDEAGVPNGITVDAEGGVWVAMVGSWSVRRFSPDGTLDRVVVLPVPTPMNLTFGGPDLRTLYVTSTYLRLPPGFSMRAPQSGKLMAVEAGVTGLAPCAFGG